MYDPKTKVWTQGKAMQCRRSAVGVAALDDKVYICGGYDGVTSLSTVECYCPKTDSWSTVSFVFIFLLYVIEIKSNAKVIWKTEHLCLSCKLIRLHQ